MRKITYCPKCGTEQMPGSRFCQSCGGATAEKMVDDNGQPAGGQWNGMNQNPQMGMNQNWQPGMNQQMGMNQRPQPGMNQPQQMGMNQRPQPGMNQPQQMGMNQRPQPGTNQPQQMNMNRNPGMNQPSQMNSGNNMNKPDGDGGKNSTMIIVCIIVAAVVIGIGVGCLIIFGGKLFGKKTSGTTETQTTEAKSTEDTNVTTEAATEEITEATTSVDASTETGTNGSVQSGGENAGYTDAELSSAAVDYCKLVYGFENPSAKVGKAKNGKVDITISVTIDGTTGEIGTMSIDKLTASGTGCKGEKADLQDPNSANVDIHYIIPYSDSRMLSDSDLQGISRSDLTLARNEIYARHGRMFKDDDIRAYFESQAWYAGIVPADQFSESVLSKTEKANISTIKAYEDYLDGDSDTGSSTVTNGDYIIPDSSTRYLSDSDVRGLDDHTLMLARNEIYARHGRKFNDAEIRAYFESKSWYYPTIDPADFTEDMLSDVEKANIAFIKSYED